MASWFSRGTNGPILVIDQEFADIAPDPRVGAVAAKYGLSSSALDRHYPNCTNYTGPAPNADRGIEQAFESAAQCLARGGCNKVH